MCGIIVAVLCPFFELKALVGNSFYLFGIIAVLDCLANLILGISRV